MSEYSYEEMNESQEIAKEALKIQGQRVVSNEQKKNEYINKILKAEKYIRDFNRIPEGFRGQPAPKRNDHEPVWKSVISDMWQRHQKGVETYGVPLQPFNGRDALWDAYEEALDLAVYLRQAIEERNAGKT